MSIYSVINLINGICRSKLVHLEPILKLCKICQKMYQCVQSKIIIYVTDGNIMYLTDASRFLISCVIQHYAPVVGWGRWRNRCIMLIMTLDPSWIQTLSLPPPGSPASQAGTLP